MRKVYASLLAMLLFCAAPASAQKDAPAPKPAPPQAAKPLPKPTPKKAQAKQDPSALGSAARQKMLAQKAGLKGQAKPSVKKNPPS